MKILIAEDDSRIIELYKDLGIEKIKNVKIFFTKNGKETEEKIKEEEFDIMLLDMFLPDKNGIEILRTIKKLKKKGDIYLLTNLSDEKTKKEALILGAKAYILKTDISIEDIKNLIRTGKLKNK